MSEWISVKDRLPEFIENKFVSENVLGVVDGKIGVYCRFIDEGWYWTKVHNIGWEDLRESETEANDEYEVTHWMPLPEPPKG